MRHLYFDCQYGISGDMTLAALIDLGADLQYIKKGLQSLPVDPFTMEVKPIEKKGISAKLLELQLNDLSHGETHEHSSHSHQEHHSHPHTHRKASRILEMIQKSELPERVKERSIGIFEEIAEAEGKIHGIDPKDVHFHEVGAMDSIIDVIGVCLALESLGVDKVTAAPVPTGYGKEKMAHGLYPIPAPATAEILRDIPIADFQAEGELTTPTGAAFLKVLSEEYGYLPPLTIEKIGYGAGQKDFHHPNVLRAILLQDRNSNNEKSIMVLECQVDDMTGEALGYIMNEMLERGVLDVYYTPVTMKKSRPGCLITVLAKPEDTVKLENFLLTETSTFGVRKTEWRRKILSRRFCKVTTPYGVITVKLGYQESRLIKALPEFEDVKRAAQRYQVQLMEVYTVAQQAATEQFQ